MLTRVTQLFNLTGFALVFESGDPFPSPVATDMHEKPTFAGLGPAATQKAPGRQTLVQAGEKGHIFISAAPPGPPALWQPPTPAYLSTCPTWNPVRARLLRPRAGSPEATPWAPGPGRTSLLFHTSPAVGQGRGLALLRFYTFLLLQSDFY